MAALESCYSFSMTTTESVQIILFPIANAVVARVALTDGTLRNEITLKDGFGLARRLDAALLAVSVGRTSALTVAGSTMVAQGLAV